LPPSRGSALNEAIALPPRTARLDTQNTFIGAIKAPKQSVRGSSGRFETGYLSTAERQTPEQVVKSQKAAGIYKPPVKPPIKKVVKPPKNSLDVSETALIQEAKKYKSADEFVKAQGTPVYHGGTEIKEVGNMRSKWGAFYMSDNPTYAKSYGGNKSVLNKMVITKKAKLADLIKPSDDLIKQIDEIISPKATGETIKIKKPDGSFVEVPITKGGLSNPVHSSADIIQGIKDGKAYYAEMPEVKEALKKLGYDGMITQESKFGVNYGVWNKDVIKTKSQLTDIWNKAHKEVKPEVKLEEKPIPKELEPLAKEARKYKSAEEIKSFLGKNYGTKFTIAREKLKGGHTYTEITPDGKLIKSKIQLAKNSVNNTDTILHEFGHLINESYKEDLYRRMFKADGLNSMSPELPYYKKIFDKEMEKMDEIMRKRGIFVDDYTNKVDERLAEFVRLFSTDRELAQRLAPQTTQSFRKVIAQDPILTDFYNQATKGTKEVKEVKKPTLPKRQPPKNIPPKKPAVVKSKTANQELIGKSKLAQGVEAKAIAKKLTEGFADLPEYEKINIKDQATKARKLLEDDYPRAERIALGKELPPEGILPESVFIAVENRAIKNKDVNTLRRLATESGLSNEATLMGQRIRTLAERVEDSPTAAMAKVIKNRKEYYALKHKTPLDEAIKRETDKIKEDIKKSAPKKDDWLDFVNSITC